MVSFQIRVRILAFQLRASLPTLAHLSDTRTMNWLKALPNTKASFSKTNKHDTEGKWEGSHYVLLCLGQAQAQGLTGPKWPGTIFSPLQRRAGVGGRGEQRERRRHNRSFSNTVAPRILPPFLLSLAGTKLYPYSGLAILAA